MLYHSHARLKLLIKFLLNFMLCTDDLLTATSSNVATIRGVDCKAASKVMDSVGVAEEENTYRTVKLGYLCTLLVQAVCWNCTSYICYTEICGRG